MGFQANLNHGKIRMANSKAIPVNSSTCPPGKWPNDCCFCLRPAVTHKNTKLIKFEEFTAFETKLFKGEILFRLPNERTAAYFKGKQRKESISYVVSLKNG